jgi:RHH-type transcriptional regulator, rel operon repressor / antitoxin RelB
MPERCSYIAIANENGPPELTVRRSAENKLIVVAVRIDPQIEQRLRLLAETTGRKQSFFLQQMIERGIDAIEETWLPHETLGHVRSGRMPVIQPSGGTPDLFGDVVDNES